MSKKKIQDYISEWMDDFGKQNGYELSRCEFVKEGSTWFLRVYVDRLIDGKYDYMTSDDCEIVSRYLSSELDAADPIPQNYYLEVSSPGLDRPLISEKDFQRFKGEAICVSLYQPINGLKLLEGILSDFNNDYIYLKNEDQSVTEIPREKTAKVNLAVII